MFYKIVISTLFWTSGTFPINLKDFVKTILPIYSIDKDFTVCFLVFYLFIPFLNKLLRAINEKEFLCLLGLLCFTYIFMGTLPKFKVTMNYVSWFVVIYFIGAYLKLYPKKFFCFAKTYLETSQHFEYIIIRIN